MRNAVLTILTAIASGLAATSSAQTPVVSPDIVWRTDLMVLPANAFGRHRVEFSPDGQWIGVIYQPEDAAIVRAADGALVQTLPQKSVWGAYAIAFSPQADRVAIGRLYAAEVLEVASGQSEGIYPCADCSVVDGVAFSPDGSLLAFQGLSSPWLAQRQVTVVAVESGRYAAVLDAATNRQHIAFSPDGRRLVASAFASANVGAALGFRVWSTQAWTEELRYAGEPKVDLGEMATGFVEDLGWVAVYGGDRAIELRALATDRVVWNVPLIPSLFAPPTTENRGTTLEHVEISADGKLLVTYEAPRSQNAIGRSFGGIVVRSARDGHVIAVYDVHGVTGLSIAPDSRTFVYATGAGEVHRALARLPTD